MKEGGPRKQDSPARLGVGPQALDSAIKEWFDVAKATDQEEHNFATGMSSVFELGVRLGLPLEVVRDAGRLTKEALVQQLAKGRSIEVVAACLTYAAARRLGYPLTVDETALSLRVSKRDVSRCFRKCSKVIGDGLPPPTADTFLAKILRALDFSPDDAVWSKSFEVLGVLSTSNFIQGRNPAAISAALIHLSVLVTRTKVTQREIARASFVTETTIRSVAKEIESILRAQADSEVA